MGTPRYRVALTVIALVTAAVVSGSSNSRMSPTRASTTAAFSTNNQPGSGASCAGALVNNPTGRLATGTMTAQIDGTSWTAVCITVNLGAPGIIGLGGSDNLTNPTTFGFGFAGSNRVGTYPVDRALGINALLTAGTAVWQAATVTNGSGTLTFTTSTPSNVAGTFSFTLVPTTVVPIKGNTARGTKVVTKGAFNISF